jgi:hypothetical protein
MRNPKYILRWEPEYDQATGRQACLVIRHATTVPNWVEIGNGQFRQDGEKQTEVMFAFDRSGGLLLSVDNEMYRDQAAREIGLERAGHSWKMPDAWLDANPWYDHRKFRHLATVLDGSEFYDV